MKKNDSQEVQINSSPPIMSVSEILDMLDVKIVQNHTLGSRGPSPMTMGLTDTIPLAVAFHEIVHACFKGNDENQCQVTITGDMIISFPAGIIQVFINNPQPAQLSFRVRPNRPLDNLVSNEELVHVQKDGEDLTFNFDMSALTTLLSKHAEENYTASYFNVDILKYHIIPKFGATSCPLHLVAFWKCEKSQTDLRIDYKYNSYAMTSQNSEDSSVLANNCNKNLAPLLEVCVAAPVDGGVKSMQSKPVGQWYCS